MPCTVSFMVIGDVILFFAVIADGEFASVSFFPGAFFAVPGRDRFVGGGVIIGNDIR